MLQDSTFLNILSLGEIAKDFTAPPAVNNIDTLASLLGVSLYFIGGTAGMGGVAAGLAASSRAASQASRVGVSFVFVQSSGVLADCGCPTQVLQAGKRWASNINDEATKAATLARLDTAIVNAEKIGENANSAVKAAGTLGASTYFVGGAFGLIGLGVDPAVRFELRSTPKRQILTCLRLQTDGQITGDDLETDLRNIFLQASTWLNQTGLMAAGHASEDTDYSLLPGTVIRCQRKSAMRSGC